MTDLTIILGNKAYSSWSLRGWLLLKRTGADFDEVVIPLDRPESKAAILAHSPSGRVPVLRCGAETIWDTLAITEFLHERFPGAGLWPADAVARAHARAVVAEMHAGFPVVRTRLPVDLKRTPVEWSPSFAEDSALVQEIARIQDIWAECRSRFDGTGDYLFGAFSAADAFFTPVVMRFITYGVAFDGAGAAYRDAVLAWPDLRDWIAAAKAEPWVLADP